MLLKSNMSCPKLSVTIITLNEERNLRRALASVEWADEVIVVDSGSTDRTLEIARELGARVFTQPWPGYGRQKNFAQAQATHDWVLNIDADEAVTPALRAEIQSALADEADATARYQGFRIPRLTWFLGRWIWHGGWYPNHLVRLARRSCAQWTEPHLHEELKVAGPVGKLREPFHHYSFASIREQVETNLEYAWQGSQELKRRHLAPSVSRLIFKPLASFWRLTC